MFSRTKNINVSCLNDEYFELGEDILKPILTGKKFPSLNS